MIKIKNRIDVDKYVIFLIELVENIELHANQTILDGIVKNHSKSC